ncbi:MAG: hypothetical protein QME62_12855 [Armatimonadota bacterium]|nr:hypothetical protein [Armatimonadota bacterium]
MILLFIILVGLIPSLCSAQYRIDWYSINSGGAPTEATGSYKLNATAGQAAVGVVTTPPYSPDPHIHYVGFWSGEVANPQQVASPIEAKLASDGSYVCISGVYATTNYSSDFSDKLYIEAGDRSSGVQFYHGSAPITSVAEGDKISVIGTMATRNGERAIVGSTVVLLAPDTPPISPLKPLGIKAVEAGGSDFQYNPETGAGQQGVSQSGLNNIGLLVRVWGTVKGTVTESDGNSYLLLDDGSKSYAPLRVDKSKIGWYPNNCIIQVTGISSVANINSQLVPVIRPRRQTDVIQIWPQP